VVSYCCWAEVVLALTCPTGVGRLGAQNAPSKSFTQSLPVPAMSTSLGVDYLVRGVAMVISGPPGRPSRRKSSGGLHLGQLRAGPNGGAHGLYRVLLFVVQVVASCVRWCFMLFMCASCVVLCLWSMF
jgi:hypothetical protein